MTPARQKIRLYTLSTCSHCIRTKKFFKDAGIDVEFTDVDLLTGEQREKIMQEVRKTEPRMHLSDHLQSMTRSLWASTKSASARRSGSSP